MSLINDALRKAESIQPAAAPPPPPVAGPAQAATPPPLPPATPTPPAAPAATTPAAPSPVKLATPPPAPAQPPATPAPAPTASATPSPLRLSLAPTSPAAPASAGSSPALAPAATPAPTLTTPLRLNLSTPAPTSAPLPPAGTLAPTPTPPPATLPPLQTAASAPAAPAPASLPPASAPTGTPAGAPAPANPEDATLESLRQQYKQAGASDALASEKAIATAALEPSGLKFRLSAPETMAQAGEAAIVATPSIPKPGTPTPPPGTPPPPAGLRVPTPELAAAFLASNPVPAGAAAGATPAPDAPPAAPGATAPVPGKPRPAATAKGSATKSANPESILLVVGGILAVLLGGGLTAAYLVFRDKPAPKSAQVSVDDGAEAMNVPEAAHPVNPSVSTPPPGTDTAVADPAATVTPDTTAASVATPTPAAAEPAPPPPPPPPRVNRPDPTILAWVQKIQLTGIRSGPVPKVFMNGKLYEVGEIVNYELGLKLTSIAGKVLYFEDAESNTYEYRF